MNRQQEIEQLERRYRKAANACHHLEARALFLRLRDLKLKQLRSELRQERRMAS